MPGRGLAARGPAGELGRVPRCGVRPAAASCSPRQDEVEAADGGGPGAAGRGRELLGPAEDVPLALFLPPQPAGQHGQHDGSRGGRGHVQQHVPDSPRAAPPAPAATGAAGADTRAGARRAAGPQPPGQSHARHPAPPVKRHRGLRNEPFPSPSPNKPQHRRGGSEGKPRGRNFCRQPPATEGGDQSEQGLLNREPRAEPVSETTTRGGRRAEPRGDPQTSAPARQDLELSEREGRRGRRGRGSPSPSERLTAAEDGGSESASTPARRRRPGERRTLH